MKLVLVAGASGYLGRFVVQELKRQGYRVRALTRNRDKLWKRGTELAPAVGSEIDEIVTADLCNPQTIQGICNNVHFVISCAGSKPFHEKQNYEHNDYLANRNLLIESINSGSVQKFVYVSMQASHQDPELEIRQAKERFVTDLQNSVMTSYILRPSPFYPSLLPLLYMAQRGKIWLPGIGRLNVSPIHGADLAKACVAGILAKEKEFEVGGPKKYNFIEVAEVAFKAHNKPAKIAAVSQALTAMTSQLLHLSNRKQHQDFIRLQTFKSQTNAAPKSMHHQGDKNILKYFQDYLKSPFFRP